MIDGVSSAQNTNPFYDAAAQKKAAESKDVATKDTFLQLLVAQIKNQNPLNPSDGVQFLSQLAQFTSLEKSISMNQELKSIHTLLDGQNVAQATVPSADINKRS